MAICAQCRDFQRVPKKGYEPPGHLAIEDENLTDVQTFTYYRCRDPLCRMRWVREGIVWKIADEQR